MIFGLIGCSESPKGEVEGKKEVIVSKTEAAEIIKEEKEAKKEEKAINKKMEEIRQELMESGLIDDETKVFRFRERIPTNYEGHPELGTECLVDSLLLSDQKVTIRLISVGTDANLSLYNPCFSIFIDGELTRFDKSVSGAHLLVDGIRSTSKNVHGEESLRMRIKESDYVIFVFDVLEKREIVVIFATEFSRYDTR